MGEIFNHIRGINEDVIGFIAISPPELNVPGHIVNVAKFNGVIRILEGQLEEILTVERFADIVRNQWATPGTHYYFWDTTFD